MLRTVAHSNKPQHGDSFLPIRNVRLDQTEQLLQWVTVLGVKLSYVGCEYEAKHKVELFEGIGIRAYGLERNIGPFPRASRKKDCCNTDEIQHLIESNASGSPHPHGRSNKPPELHTKRMM
jgi:hypothetical protein